jgi:hypothetical protein
MAIFAVSRAAIARPRRLGYEILGHFFSAIATPRYRCFEFLDRFGVNLEAFSDRWQNERKSLAFN